MRDVENHQDIMARCKETKTHDCRIPRAHLPFVPFHYLNNINIELYRKRNE